MQKRDDFLLKNVASFQIFLIVFSVFSFAFLISESSSVKAQSTIRGNFVGEKFVPNDLGNSYQRVDSAGKTFFTDLSGKDITPPARPPEPAAPKIVNSYVPKTFSSEKGFNIKDIPGTSGEVNVNRAVRLEDGRYQLYESENPVGTPVAEETFNDISKQASEHGAGFKEIGPPKEVTPFKDSLTGITGGWGHLISGFLAAVAVAGAIKMVGSLVGLDDGLTDALSLSVGAGMFATDIIKSFGPTGFGDLGADSWLLTDQGWMTGAGWIGLAVAVVAFALLYKKESVKIINFQCLPYEAPVGGRNCERCNGDAFRPCSEYRCKSLGQSCELVNVGSSDEKCVWVNPNDPTPPTITPWTTPLTENHRYTSLRTRPDSRGTRIELNGATNGCIKAFTPLTFGITTNEPAQCKIDLEHKNTLDEMQFFFGNNNLYLYNHTQQFSLPSPGAMNAELPELQNNGEYDFFIRCRDKNGNENVDEFDIQFCVDPSPDTTAPVIIDTSIPSESFVKFGVGSVPLQVYVNEPATCKWSSQNKEYSVMENTMNCATSLTQINARELYTCLTNLTGIKDREENNFFFRCKDQPSKPEEDRNVNVASYEFKLLGSQPLNIISVGPNGTATGSTQTVPVNLRVVTDDGSNEGTAICSFSSTGLPNSYVMMFETKAVEHTQRLDLTTGNYNYRFRCVDYGGNAAEANVTFSVLVDNTPPLITRAYHDYANTADSALKIVTNEEAACTYSLNSCNFNFNEGIALLNSPPSNKRNHYAEWKSTMVYYIKCKDNFDNEPAPNTCSIVASATNVG